MPKIPFSKVFGGVGAFFKKPPRVLFARYLRVFVTLAGSSGSGRRGDEG